MDIFICNINKKKDIEISNNTPNSEKFCKSKLLLADCINIIHAIRHTLIQTSGQPCTAFG